MSEDIILSQSYRQEVIKDILTSKESKDRKAEHLKRAEVYTDRTREYVLRQLEAEFSGSTALEMAHRTPNLSLTRKVVNKKARVYKDRPVRIADDKSQQEQLEAFVDLTGLDNFGKALNRAVELHKNVEVKVLPTREPDGTYCIRLGILRPHEYDVISDPADPTRKMALILSYTEDVSGFLADYRTADAQGQVIAANRAAKTKDEKRFVWWSDSYHFVTNEAGDIVEAPQDRANPFGIMPFVSFALGESPVYWRDGGEGLADNAILINVLLADLNFSAKYQSTGVGYLFGDDLPDQVAIGPNKFLKIKHQEGQPTPQLGFANPNPALEANMRLIEQQLAFFLTSEDLEPGAISGTLTGGSASSGIQEVIQKAEPVAAIEDQQQLYKDREPYIARVFAKVVNRLAESRELSPEYADALGMAEDIDYILSFIPPKPFQTETERLAVVAAKKALGLYTDLDLLADLYPDLGEADLKKKLEAIRAEKAEKAPDFTPSPDKQAEPEAED